jgi:hypothetical protein
MTAAERDAAPAAPSLRAPVLWGVVVGTLQAASPYVFWWLEPATVYALGLILIAAVYIGFAVAGVTGPVWLLVLGFVGHGLKDLWQHRTRFVAGTRWWPPFCLVVDWVVAAVLMLLILAGVTLRG